MPKFLTVDELYRLIQRELPEDVYADGPPGAFRTTADSYATASGIAIAYANLQRIYNNHFPQYADERIADWEFKVFKAYQDSMLSLEERQQRILTKLRARPGIRPDDVKAVAHVAIGTDKDINIVEFCGHPGLSWVLDESALNIDTYLNAFSGMEAGLFGPDLCDKTAADLGITEAELKAYQDQAYTYEVRINGYTLTTDEYRALDAALTQYEPARSNHRIISPYPPPVVIYEWTLDMSGLDVDSYLSP